MAPSGATFISGSRWGSWNGKLAVALLERQGLWIVDLGVCGQLLDQGFAIADRGRLRSVAQGPDGNLYLTTDNGGGADQILRVTPG